MVPPSSEYCLLLHTGITFLPKLHGVTFTQENKFHTRNTNAIKWGCFSLRIFLSSVTKIVTLKISMRNYTITFFFCCIFLICVASHVVRYIAESANWVKCLAESYKQHSIESDKYCDHFTNTERRLNITCKLKLIYATNSWISQWHNYSVLVGISFHFIGFNVSGHNALVHYADTVVILYYTCRKKVFKFFFSSETSPLCWI